MRFCRGIVTYHIFIKRIRRSHTYIKNGMVWYGMVVEHPNPSWEDLIGIENREAKIKKLDKEIESIAGLPGT